MTPQPQTYGASTNSNEPRDDLDVAFSIIRSSEYDELLEQINFGTGYYEDAELRMQMRNVRKGLVTDIAFSRTLRTHAEQETKVKLADEGFRYYNEEMDEPRTWRAFEELGDRKRDEFDGNGRTAILLERGEEIWADLARPAYSLSIEQAAALDAKTGMSTFKPIFHHLAAIFHEQTKSKGARTQDNYFGRKQVTRFEGDTDQAKKRLSLGRNR